MFDVILKLDAEDTQKMLNAYTTQLEITAEPL